MEKNLLRYIWMHSSRHQVMVLALTLLSFPVLYASLELPKRIINDALQQTQPVRDLFGVELGPIAYLLLLCFVFLALVVISGMFKMRINTMKGIIGERLVRRLRYQLVERILRFPLPHFSKVSQGELISTVTSETEPLAGFSGDAYAQPLFQGGTMVTILFFMFMQDPLLGLASCALIPLQAYVIPRLQRQVNRLGKERVKRVRRLSERIGETVDGVRDIRINGTVRYTLAEFSHQLGAIFWIRLEIYKKKFFIKFLNNFINQLTPFFFYAIGGVLVLQGNLSIGALVAALSAFKDLTAPWKELLDYYQQWADCRIKYEQIVEQFSPDDMVEFTAETPDSKIPADLKAPIRIEGLSWSNEYGDRVLRSITAEIPAGSFVGIAGTNVIALRRMAELMVRLSRPESGRITIHGHDIGTLPMRLMGVRLAYAGPEPRMFTGSIMQNATYGLRHRPPVDDPERISETRRREIEEAVASGNSPDSFEDVWTDFAVIGGAGWDDVRHWWRRCMTVVGGDAIVLQNGLKEIFEPEDFPLAADRILGARAWLHRALVERGLEGVIERFDENVFGRAASVAENVLFGLPDDRTKGVCALGSEPEMIDRLRGAGLWDQAATIGRHFAAKLRATYGAPEQADLRRERFPYLTDELFEEMIQALDRLEREGEAAMSEPVQKLFVGLFFAIVPRRDGEELIDYRMQTKLLALRQALRTQPIAALDGAVAPFDPNGYNRRLSVEDNLLFGRLNSDDPQAISAVRALVRESLDATDATDFVMILFALSEVGIGGSRLPVAARQRIQFVRALMKKPDIFVVHQALGNADGEEQALIYQRTRALLPDLTLIVLEERLPQAADFDVIYDLVDGRLTRRGAEVSAAPVQPVITTAKPAEYVDEALRAIARSAIFADLPQATLRLLAASSEWRTVKAGDFVYQSGEPSAYVFVLVEGTAAIVRLMPDGEERHVVDLEPPEVIGDLELMAGTRRFSTIRARTDIRVLRIDGPMVMRLVASNPALPLKVIEAVGRRFTQEDKV